MSDTTGVRRVERTRRGRRLGFIERMARRREERGYIMVTTVIMLPLLLILVSAATDVTYYYSKTVEIQRIADTAALAGVVRMPNLPDAQNVAYGVAIRNGAQNANAGVTVNAEAPEGSSRRLKVTVRDTRVKLFFGSLFKEYWDIARSSTAEYVSNIPLGSVLNAIGTGDLSGAIDPLTGLPTTTGNGLSATPQNFWLSVTGPCAAKEAGDQLSSRYDGTNINATVSPGNVSDNKYYRLCDWVNEGSDEATRVAKIKADQLASPAGLFPGLSINRDHQATGYDYIVDVPCLPTVAGGAIPAPPCPAGQVISQDLKIDMFDPAFNPDSLQRFFSSNTQTKPDTYGVRRKSSNGCVSSAYLVTPAVCTGSYGAGRVSPADVRVVTEVRMYPTDGTPVDTSDDVPMTVAASLNRTSDPVFGAGKVLRFGTCMNATDTWTNINAVTGALEPMPDTNHDYIPDTPGSEPALTALPGGDVAADPDCASNASKWRNLITVPAGQPRGRYRVNVHTVSSAAGYGTNAFSLRASFGNNFASCSSLSDPSTCPAVSGDSTMSVFASVPGISDFYLAQLSPASLFRNKTVVLQLWDIGEGGDTVEVLRPISQASQCPSTPMVGTNYCVQTFDWSIWNPGVNKVDSANALERNGAAMPDVCVGKGQTNQTKLSVAGHWDTSLSSAPSYTPTSSTTGNSLCTATVDTGIVGSRGGFAPLVKVNSNGGTPTGLCSGSPVVNSQVSCQAGRFNDRIVALQIQIPKDYGCNPGTGTDTIPCVDATSLPEGGWWRIRYTPMQKNWDTGYVEMTDQTTWTVQLLGDPVHLIQG